MSDTINGRTPEEIKAAFKQCPSGFCRGCPYVNIYDCEAKLQEDTLAYIEHLEAQLDKARLVQDCSTCGEEYCDVHFYPCCACHNTAPVSMSKWHPEGTKAPPCETLQHVLEEEEKRRRREWEEFMREDTESPKGEEK